MQTIRKTLEFTKKSHGKAPFECGDCLKKYFVEKFSGKAGRRNAHINEQMCVQLVLGHFHYGVSGAAYAIPCHSINT